MKQITYYGPKDLRLEEVSTPEPGPGEIVIKMQTALTCGTDVKMYMRGYRYDPPHGMGHEGAGVVYAIGEGVTNFAVGDRVVPHNTAPCQHCSFCKRGQSSLCSDLVVNFGAFGEYWKIPARIVEQNTFLIPDDMSFKQAALMEPFSCAVYGTSQVPIEFGDVVAVNGCGPIGLMFVRLARLRGAQVLATDTSRIRLDAARRMGASHTVEISEGIDQVSAVRDLTVEGRGVDVAIEAVGLPAVWNMAFNMVRPGGFALLFGGTKKGAEVSLDCTKLHYEQITIKGVYHTTPKHVAQAFELLRMGVINAEDFVQKEFVVEEAEKALIDHAEGNVIKNCITF